jgi:hypothetical protein
MLGSTVFQTVNFTLESAVEISPRPKTIDNLDPMTGIELLTWIFVFPLPLLKRRKNQKLLGEF